MKYTYWDIGDDDLITITNRFNVEHRLPRSFAEKLGSVNLENRLEKISKKTTAFLANSDEIMPSNYYEHILKSKKKFNNVVLLDTNHFFTTNRKPLFDHILSLEAFFVCFRTGILTKAIYTTEE